MLTDTMCGGLFLLCASWSSENEHQSAFYTGMLLRACAIKVKRKFYPREEYFRTLILVKNNTVYVYPREK